MSANDRSPAAEPSEGAQYRRLLSLYLRGLSVIMLFLGLRQWAVILGIVGAEAGGFEALTTPWKLATMHFAVADLVAAVGLWMRVSWGTVLWVYAALAEIAIHTVFIATFGSDIMVTAFHVLTLAIFATLEVLVRRHPQLHG